MKDKAWLEKEIQKIIKGHIFQLYEFQQSGKVDSLREVGVVLLDKWGLTRRIELLDLQVENQFNLDIRLICNDEDNDMKITGSIFDLYIDDIKIDIFNFA